MKFGSLFSGIGGFDLGLERGGMECVWQAEIDQQASSVLARHWPSVKRYRHVESINYRTGKAYRRYYKPEPVDLICGGFPCQDLSVAGKRAGLAGERSGLWFEFRRILEQHHPQWAVIENVPGLLSSNDGRDFAIILRGLVELGYGVCWRVLDAQYFGVAQRRRRVFIVGSLGDGSAAEVLFEREGRAGDTPPRRQAGQRVAATIESGTNRTGGTRPPGTTVDTAETLQVARALSTRNGRLDPNGEYFVADALTSVRGGADVKHAQAHQFIAWDNGQGDPNADEDGTAFALNGQANQGVAMTFEARYARNGRGAPGAIVPPLKAESGQTGKGDGAPLVLAFAQNQRDEVRDLHDLAGAVAAEPGMKQQTYVAHTLRAEGHDASEDGTGRGVPMTVARSTGAGWYTEDEKASLRAEPGGTTFDILKQGMGVRRLTPVECERLQGFPDGHTAGQADSARYRQLGNAICVNVAEWLGQRIVALGAGDGPA